MWLWNAIRKQENSNAVVAAATLVIAAAALLGLIVAFLQWCAISGANKISQQQATLMKQQLVGTQAAVLKLSTSFDIEGFVFGLTNIRDTDATKVYVNTTMTRISLPNGIALASPVIHTVMPQRIEKDHPFAERLPIPWPVQREMQEGWPGKQTVKANGEYGYEDGFGTKISGNFCEVWLPILNIVTRRENATVGGSVPCEGIESTINDILARKKQADQEKKAFPN